jgi:hypothetical protein
MSKAAVISILPIDTLIPNIDIDNLIEPILGKRRSSRNMTTELKNGTIPKSDQLTEAKSDQKLAK